MNTRSRIYKELSDQEIELIIKRHFNAQSFHSRLISGGLFNTTYLLDVENDKYILRAGPVNRELLLAFELNLMEPEAYAYELCRQAGVPVSEVTAWDNSKTLIDRDYMLVKYIEDTSPLIEVKLSAEESDRIHFEVGKYARKINGITSESFGRVKGKRFSSWSGFFEYELADWKEKVLEHEVFSEQETDRILSAFRRNRHLFDQIKEPCLIHTDLWAGNILLKKVNERYRVAAIIDIDRALFGDIEFELASGWMINKSFLSGYGKIPEETKESRIRKKLYQIFYQLLDTYILKAEYNNPEDSLSNKKSVQMLLQKFEEEESINDFRSRD